MAWRRIGDKPLSEPMLIRFTDEYMQHYGGDELTHWSLGDHAVVIFIVKQNSSLSTCCEIALRWMPQNVTIQKSTLVQVMAWCHQAPSHYLSQCWPICMLPFGTQWDINKMVTILLTTVSNGFSWISCVMIVLFVLFWLVFRSFCFGLVCFFGSLLSSIQLAK